MAALLADVFRKQFHEQALGLWGKVICNGGDIQATGRFLFKLVAQFPFFYPNCAQLLPTGLDVLLARVPLLRDLMDILAQFLRYSYQFVLPVEIQTFVT